MMEAMLQRVCFIPYRGRGMSHHQRLGHRRSRRRGEGLEFDQIREYQTGEGIRRVNWAATARRGNSALLVNHYYEDKALTMMLLVDLSASMDFGSQRLTKKMLAAELSASLVYSALRCNDRVGLIGFTSEVVCYFPPQQTRQYQWTIPEAILHHDSTRTTANFGAAVVAMKQYLKHRSLVFLMSDFLSDDTDQFTQMLSWLHHKHDLISLRLTDPREMSLPAGRARMTARDLETGKRMVYSFSARQRRRMADKAQARQQRLSEIHEQLGVSHLNIMPESDYGEDLTQLFLTPQGRASR